MPAGVPPRTASAPGAPQRTVVGARAGRPAAGRSASRLVVVPTLGGGGWRRGWLSVLRLAAGTGAGGAGATVGAGAAGAVEPLLRRHGRHSTRGRCCTGRRTWRRQCSGGRTSGTGSPEFDLPMVAPRAIGVGQLGCDARRATTTSTVCPRWAGLAAATSASSRTGSTSAARATATRTCRPGLCRPGQRRRRSPATTRRHRSRPPGHRRR